MTQKPVWGLDVILIVGYIASCSEQPFLVYISLSFLWLVSTVIRCRWDVGCYSYKKYFHSFVIMFKTCFIYLNITVTYRKNSPELLNSGKNWRSSVNLVIPAHSTPYSFLGEGNTIFYELLGQPWQIYILHRSFKRKQKLMCFPSQITWYINNRD